MQVQVKILKALAAICPKDDGRPITEVWLDSRGRRARLWASNGSLLVVHTLDTPGPIKPIPYSPSTLKALPAKEFVCIDTVDGEKHQSRQLCDSRGPLTKGEHAGSTPPDIDLVIPSSGDGNRLVNGRVGFNPFLISQLAGTVAKIEGVKPSDKTGTEWCIGGPLEATTVRLGSTLGIIMPLRLVDTRSVEDLVAEFGAASSK